MKKERKQLPTLAEWFEIRVWTASRNWSVPEREMMQAADRHHLAVAGRALGVAALLALAFIFVLARWKTDREATHSAGLVRTLREANIAQVPKVVAELDRVRSHVEPLLRKIETRDPEEQLHVRLALLPWDESQVDPLSEELLEAEPDHFRVLLESLRSHRARFVPRMRAELASPRARSGRRFRAAAALASADRDNTAWDVSGPFVAQQLIAQPSLLIPKWLELFRPIKGALIAPLSELFRDASPSRAASRVMVASILADYAADRPADLARVLADANATEFPILFAPLERHRPEAIAALEPILDRATSTTATGASAEAHAAQGANAAIALARLGRFDRLWPRLRATPRPYLRSYLIDRIATLGCDPKPLAEHIDHEPDDSIKAAILIALAEFDASTLPGTLPSRLQSLYREHPDPEIHAAAGLLLRRIGKRQEVRDIDRSLASEQNPNGRRWYVNREGQTLIIFEHAGEYVMGSPVGERGRFESEFEHVVRFEHSFEVSATEVTVAQFRRFLEDPENEDVRPRFAHLKKAADDLPALQANWYDGARYCNWLSKREGLTTSDLCYVPNSDGKFDAGMSLAPKFVSLRGYRMPAEGEWEFVCRAGTTTSRHYGDSDELLDRYACVGREVDGAMPVGSFRPNQFGFFDMLGNAIEWCHDRYRFYEKEPIVLGAPDRDGTLIDGKDFLNVRGGGFIHPAKHVRAARRFGDRPSFVNDAGGFRIARSRP